MDNGHETAITFYEQMRQDGGLRIGVDVDGEPILGEFVGPDADGNPALTWYVDVRCAGKRLPTDAESARQWLLDRSPIIRGALQGVADELRVGLDFGVEPLIRPAAASVDERILIACLALDRERSRQLHAVVADLAAHWDEHVCKLPVLQDVAI